MDRETRGILVGMVLGDGYINTSKSTSSRGYASYKSELRVLHGTDQAEYCEYKADRLRQALGRKCRVTTVRNGPGGKYKAVQFVVGHKYFRQLKRWIYPCGKKRITRPVLDMLTPEGIAFWYMDDGHARRNRNSEGRVTSVATDICTYVSQEEAEAIASYFLERHGIRFRVIRSKGSYNVQASTEESRKFVRFVLPHIIPSLSYKVSHVDGLDSHERRAPVAQCRECDGPIYENRRGGLCTACYNKQRYHARKTPT